MFNRKLFDQANEDLKLADEHYQEQGTILADQVKDLYQLRLTSIALIKKVQAHVSKLAKTPKDFQVTQHQIMLEIEAFDLKEETVKRAGHQTTLGAGAAATGTTLAALGVAVATMGPTAAMGIATTFGVASTGTAIASLSGAAANSAALAWLGMGTVAAGGGGMAAGTTLLALAGPVGWTVAGIAGTASVVTGVLTARKNKSEAGKLVAQRLDLEKASVNIARLIEEVADLNVVTERQRTAVREANKAVTGTDYASFTHDEKAQAGLLVNATLTLAQLVNKEMALHEED
ncbi:hypothetical protein [Lacticaseibacillus yichunensis]|uniref:Uncharacterized protein n=1 Tax=Lacticaseibacillus yichunensis TaxID=2486015 RepID=A0ABW4CUG4_9LACO|nr:hypothetical protein [Lacticaseibacillus yichunensis]